jgi:hypothetical protein
MDLTYNSPCATIPTEVPKPFLRIIILQNEINGGTYLYVRLLSGDSYSTFLHIYREWRDKLLCPSPE